jgi:hypothetical protein
MGAAASGNSMLGIPKSVGKEFIAADPGGKLPKHAPRNNHMAQRKSAGLTNTAIGKEFGVHKSTVGRALKQGFVNGGSAR